MSFLNKNKTTYVNVLLLLHYRNSKMGIFKHVFMIAGPNPTARRAAVWKLFEKFRDQLPHSDGQGYPIEAKLVSGDDLRYNIQLHPPEHAQKSYHYLVAQVRMTHGSKHLLQ